MPGLAVGLGTLLALSAAEPSSTKLPVAITYDAPASCMDRDAFVADVEQLAGAEILDEDATALVSVELEEASSGFELTLIRSETQRGLGQTRTIFDEDCDTLAHAAALVVAVNEEPVAPRRWVDVPPAVMKAEPVVQTDSVVADHVPHIEPSDPPREPAIERDVRADLLVRAGLALGMTPAPTGALGGGVRLGGRRFDVEMSAAHAFATEARIAPGIGIRAASTSGELVIGVHHELGPFEGRVGAGVRIGALHGAGTGRRVIPQPTRASWWAVPVVAGGTWPASSRLAANAQVEASWVALRPAIGLQTPAGEPGPAVRLRRGALTVTLGLRLRMF